MKPTVSMTIEPDDPIRHSVRRYGDGQGTCDLQANFYIGGGYDSLTSYHPAPLRRLAAALVAAADEMDAARTEQVA